MRLDYDLRGEHSFALAGQTAVVGRASTADVVLDHWSVSRRHAVIERVGDEWWIADAESANGISINGTRVRHSRLRGGDALSIGAVEMRVVDEEAAHEDFLSSLPTQTVVRPVADAAVRDTSAALLVDAARVLLAEHELDRIASAIGNLVLSSLHAGRVLIAVTSVQPPLLCSFGPGVALPLSRALLRVVEERRVSILIPNVQAESALAGAQSIVDAAMRAVMCAPLHNDGRIAGAILAEAPDEEQFDGAKLELLTALANLVAVAVERAREREMRTRLAHELEVGRRIQSSFLPESLPSTDLLRLESLFLPARQVSGDFYDAFGLPDGKTLAIVVGDVCDKGVGAALFMALFRSLIRAHALAGCHPSQIMRNVSDFIVSTHGNANMFATLFFASIDPASGAVTYVNAGHEPPVIVGSAQARELAPTAPACGIMADSEFPARSECLAPGETLAIWTDGVTDARDASNQPFGRDRAIASIRSGSVSALEAALRGHIGPADVFDDITALIATRR